LKVGDVREENVGSKGFDGEVEEGEIPKVGKGKDEDVAKAIDKGEGMEASWEGSTWGWIY